MSNSLRTYWETYEKSKDINWKPELEGWNPSSELLPPPTENCVGHGANWEEQVERVVEAILVLLILVLLSIIYYWTRCKRNRQVSQNQVYDIKRLLDLPIS